MTTKKHECVCYYCMDKFQADEPRVYCSETCKELDRKNFEEYERLKEFGFYSNDPANNV